MNDEITYYCGFCDEDVEVIKDDGELVCAECGSIDVTPSNFGENL